MAHTPPHLSKNTHSTEQPDGSCANERHPSESRSAGTPAAEVKIDESLVQHLLKTQFPDLQALPIQPAESGWDNAIFRLGDRLAIRLPRRQLAAKLIEHEQVWLPQFERFLAKLPIAIPVPIRLGKPAQHYPWCWSIFQWIPGDAADVAPVDGIQAEKLVDFLRAIHIPAPANAPHNEFRSVSLDQKAPKVENHMQQLATTTDLITPKIKEIWQTAIATPRDAKPTWIHGDLHPRNVLVDAGVITGVIDWGDMTEGDVATDLAALWMLFEKRCDRQIALEKYGASVATQNRAKGWAIFFGTVLLASGLVDNPRNARLGRKILRYVEED